MKITIVSMRIVADEAKRASGLRASADIMLDDAIKVRRVNLHQRTDGYVVFPPAGRRAGDNPVTWDKTSKIVRDLTEVLADAYEAMTDA